MKPSPDLTIFHERESAVRGYCRRFPTLFNRARGSILYDSNGCEYIDFLAGCASLNYGHNDPDMSAALVAHIKRHGVCQGLDTHTDAKQHFLEVFSRLILAPRGMSHRVQFTGPTGTNAVEAALKLARKVTGRQNVIAFTNGYHGVSLGSLAVTGNRYNRMGMPLPGVTRTPYDRYFGPEIDTAGYLEQMLGDPSSGIDAPAAIILETVQGEGGLNAASAPWIRRIAGLAKKHGALLIIDDVQAGCGRTGTFFSFEGMEVEPDLVVLSKSLSGFGLPMSLLLVREDRDEWRPAEHNGTFRGNNHAFVTAAVAIEKFWSDGRFTAEIRRRAEIVHGALSDISTLVPGSFLKGRGMMLGLCVGSGELADRISRLCFERGLVIETAGPNDEVIKILAPLTTPLAQLRQGLLTVRQATVDVVSPSAELMAAPVPLVAAAPVPARRGRPSLV